MRELMFVGIIIPYIVSLLTKAYLHRTLASTLAYLVLRLDRVGTGVDSIDREIALRVVL